MALEKVYDYFHNYDNRNSNCTKLVSHYSPGNATQNIGWLSTKIYS